MARTTPRETLESILGHLGFVFEIEEAARDGKVILNIKSRDPQRLIGRDGHVIEDLQYLVNRIVGGTDENPTPVTVDVDGYRRKEEEVFLTRIRDTADKVRQSGEPVTLPPMNSYDRRRVHQLFEGDPDILTRSEEGPQRLKQVTLLSRHHPPA